MDRTLTKILLAYSNNESTTSGSSDNDWFGPWTTSEVCEAGAVLNDGRLTKREVVESTRLVTSRYRGNATGTTLSYNDLKEGGCFNPTTFQYVPDSGAYLAFKLAARMDMMGKQRRHYGFDRSGKTKSMQGGDSGGAISRLGSCDDRIMALSPKSRVDTFQHQTNPTACACSDSDETTQQQTAVDLQSDYYQSMNGNHVKEKEANLSRGRQSSEATATCSGDVNCADEIKTKHEQQCSDSRQVKTWLYTFLPPLATMRLGHGDANPPQENLAEVHDHGLPQPKSRIVGGRSRGRYPNDERHTIVGSRKLQTRLDDDETGTTRRRQRQPRSAASDDAVHSHGQRGRQTADVDRRRRYRSSDIASDDYQVYFTETCLLPHCDCRHHQQVTSEHEDETTITPDIIGNDDDDKTDNIDDDATNAADNYCDDDEEEKTEKEAVKTSPKSFNSRLDKNKMKPTNLGLTGRVIDIHRRHDESCNS